MSRAKKNTEISSKSVLDIAKGLAARVWVNGKSVSGASWPASVGIAGSFSLTRQLPSRCTLAESDCASIVRKRGLRRGWRAPSSPVRASLLPSGRSAL